MIFKEMFNINSLYKIDINTNVMRFWRIDQICSIKK